MPTATTKPPALSKTQTGGKDPGIAELETLVDDVHQHLRKGCYGALRIGLRLIHLHSQAALLDAPGGFRAALKAIQGKGIAPSTAYRWINAASGAVMRIQHIEDAALIELPAPGSNAWEKLEAALEKSTHGLSLRRLTIGSASSQSDECRLDNLISAEEQGDTHATEFLDKIASGEMTLVQAIRAQAGAQATKGKSRKDPVYLDLDGKTGQPVGLFPRCILTMANTFARWDQLDENARHKAKSAWKALVSNLPSELR